MLTSVYILASVAIERGQVSVILQDGSMLLTIHQLAQGAGGNLKMNGVLCCGVGGWMGGCRGGEVLPPQKNLKGGMRRACIAQAKGDRHVSYNTVHVHTILQDPSHIIAPACSCTLLPIVNRCYLSCNRPKHFFCPAPVSPSAQAPVLLWSPSQI